VLPTYDLLKLTDKTQSKLLATTMCRTNQGYVWRCLKKGVFTARFQTLISYPP